MHGASDVGYRCLDLTPNVRIFLFELLPNVLRRFRDHLLENMPGNISALAEVLGKNGIVLRAF